MIKSTLKSQQLYTINNSNSVKNILLKICIILVKNSTLQFYRQNIDLNTEYKHDRLPCYYRAAINAHLGMKIKFGIKMYLFIKSSSI